MIWGGGSLSLSNKAHWRLRERRDRCGSKDGLSANRAFLEGGGRHCCSKIRGYSGLSVSGMGGFIVARHCGVSAEESFTGRRGGVVMTVVVCHSSGWVIVTLMYEVSADYALG